MELLRELAEARQNKLYAHEYDDTTWSARTWMSYNVQKLSVAVHRTMAMEIAHAVGIPTAVDGRLGE